jgi:hypothetical protein
MASITINFTPSSPAPALGYKVLYKQVGTDAGSYNSVNATASPVVISGLPDGKSWHGTVQAICSKDSTSPEQPWSVSQGLLAYIYLANSGTAGGKGVRIWFTPTDLYNTNPQQLPTAANSYNTTQMGVAPDINIPIRYWRDDMVSTLDNGTGGVRAHDGTKTINCSANNLIYNATSGAWEISSNIFTADEGSNIAAFAIDLPTPSTYVNAGINYGVVIPSPVKFIRVVDQTFSAGNTGVTFYDIF